MALSLHFFCQVKTTKHAISSNYYKKHLEYWKRQPAPVFVFNVVYGNATSVNENNCKVYVHDISYVLQKQHMKSHDIENMDRNVEETFMICEESNNKNKMTLDDFINHHISWCYGEWYICVALVL